jgi:hypothetical protein
VLKAQYTKGEWGRLRRFPMKRVLKGNGEHTKIQQKRKFPMKRVLKGARVPAKPRWMGSSFP